MSEQKASREEQKAGTPTKSEALDGVLDVGGLDEEELDLLSPLSLATVLARRRTGPATPSQPASGLLDAFEEQADADFLL